MKNLTSGMCCVLISVMWVGAAECDDVSSPAGLPLFGTEAVEFLEGAEIVGEPEPFDEVAITGPLRVTLSDGEQTHRAVFKDENTLYPEFRYGDGREVERAKDSYKHELAAFELDQMLGLGLVPPCVVRKIDSRKGSLCLWVEGAMDEGERVEKRIDPPDPQDFRGKILEVKLFQQLIADLDFSNIRNVVADPDFRVYKIDSSMAFYPDPELLSELDYPRLSRRFLQALKALDKKAMDERLSPWLLKVQRRELWARRDRILERAEKLIADRGEDEVLY